MFSKIKTYAVALAALALTASAVAQTAKTVTVTTDTKTNTVKAQVIEKAEAKAPAVKAAVVNAAGKIDKTDKSNKLSYDPKAVLAKDADYGIGTPLASLPRIGKYKKGEIDMTKWHFLPEYEDAPCRNARKSLRDARSWFSTFPDEAKPKSKTWAISFRSNSARR